MKPDEIALTNKGGRSFVDLCDDVRRAKSAHLSAIRRIDQIEDQLKSAKLARDEAINAEDDALDALDEFIRRECAVAEGA